MQIFFSEKHRLHAPSQYLADGTMRPVPEAPARVEAILAALRGGGHDVREVGEAADPMPTVKSVHTGDYLEYLRTIQGIFAAEFGVQEVIPDTFFPPGRQARRPAKPSAQAGYYCFDLAAPIAAGTFAAALAAARCAVAGADAVARGGRHGERAAYALCRPPGHHAGAAYCGGFCYINNAAVAAERLITSGMRRVGILDIDYHHGNGTQDIFYWRGDVMFVSVHADSNTQYPYFWGYADETGDGAGAGRTLNLPLARGAGEETWVAAVRHGAAELAAFGAQAIVVSFGADVHENDTVGDFAISFGGLTRAGEMIAGMKLPTVIVQEGGYNLETIGECVAAFLGAFPRHY